MPDSRPRLIADLLADLGLAGAEPPRVTGEPHPPALASPLAVAECATAAVAAGLTAAAELAAARTGRRPAAGLDTAHVAAAVRSEAWLRDPAGRGIDGFAPLSRLWPAADGWVRTHANYPWHRSALLAALGLTDGRDEDVAGPLGAAIAARSAEAVQDAVYAAGGLAVAAGPPGGPSPLGARALAAAGPPVRLTPLGTAPAATLAGAGGGGPSRGPAAGVRVLDLTRVIAGPVGTRTLAAFGAQVLRVDDPRRPELASQVVEGIVGKRSTALDLRTEAGTAALHDLLGRADVLVTGYRPGALRRFGLEPAAIAERYPGMIVATLSAWGGGEQRRGFDSLVQVASGIGWACRPDRAGRDGAGPDGAPGALPCQLLDHAGGYLLAAGVLAALAGRVRTGAAAHVEVSLAGIARWLLRQGTRAVPEAEVGAGNMRYRTMMGGGWSGIGPPGTLDGEPLRWAVPAGNYAQAPPVWE